MSYFLRSHRSSGRHHTGWGGKLQDPSAMNSPPPESRVGKSAPKMPNSQRNLCGLDPTRYGTPQQHLQPKLDPNKQHPTLEYLVNYAGNVLHITAVSSQRRGIKVILKGNC